MPFFALIFAIVSAAILLPGCSGAGPEAAPVPRARWTEAEAAAWYEVQPWLVGANFVPSTAINQLEMWQPETYDAQTIDRELGWAAGLGFNTMRVFLHDLLWIQGPEAFLDRIDGFLTVADRHGISVMLVLFDGVWNPHPVDGPQPAAVPHVHNSQWVQGPGAEILGDLERHDELEPYVRGVVGRFRNDPRVLAWDLFNEPDNPNILSYASVELRADVKDPAAVALLRKAFDWARAMGPIQPLTAGVWQGKGEWGNPDALSSMNELMLTQSDVVSFHSYDAPEAVREQIADLQRYGRPVLCTEYMARSVGSTFQGVLPIFDDERVGAYNWGLVSGPSQTIYAWTSWLTMSPSEADPWFHDVLHPDGSPYDAEEAALIRELTGR